MTRLRCCFFLSKSPGGHVFSFQIKPWVAFGLPYLSIEIFYIGMPVVWTDGRSLARSVYSHVITKFSGMGRLLHLLSYRAPPTCGASRVELRYHAERSISTSPSYLISPNCVKAPEFVVSRSRSSSSFSLVFLQLQILAMQYIQWSPYIYISSPLTLREKNVENVHPCMLPVNQ